MNEFIITRLNYNGFLDEETFQGTLNEAIKRATEINVYLTKITMCYNEEYLWLADIDIDDGVNFNNDFYENQFLFNDITA